MPLIHSCGPSGNICHQGWERVRRPRRGSGPQRETLFGRPQRRAWFRGDDAGLLYSCAPAAEAASSAPALVRNALRSISNLWSPDDLSALDHQPDMLDGRDVACGIALDGDEIGK